MRRLCNTWTLSCGPWRSHVALNGRILRLAPQGGFVVMQTSPGALAGARAQSGPLTGCGLLMQLRQGKHELEEVWRQFHSQLPFIRCAH